MKLDRFGWGGVVLALGLATPFAASAQSASDDRLSPARLMEGPSLQETGRVGVMTPELPSGIAGEKELSLKPEKEVAPVAEELAVEPLRPRGIVDQTRLGREIDGYFAALDDCRMNVARAKQVLPAGVVADTLLLRWTILPNGHTGMTTVVATSPTDGEVMDCVKAAMARWTFAAPRGGPVPVERTFAFRTLPQP
jgi:hypothetical protein